MRRKLFAQSLREQNITAEQVDEEYSHAVHVVERELGMYITEDYLLVKFWNQFEEVKWYRELEKKENDSQMSKVRR